LFIYFTSVLLLVNTGVMGAGMVCVIFSLVLAGCLLDKKQAYQVVIVNIIVFTALTALLILSQATFHLVLYFIKINMHNFYN
jgi:hypothetical protein